jgi:hypothetical protein
MITPEPEAPFVLPKGYRWADERDEEEITPRDQTRQDRAAAKRERKRNRGLPTGVGG